MRLDLGTQRWLQPCAVLLLGTAGMAGAQTLTPGAVGDTLKPAPQLQAPAAKPQIQRGSAAAPSLNAQATRFTVSRFVFEGNTLYDAAKLNELVSGFTNRPITLLEVYAAADVVAEYYVGNGYSLVSVNVPPQKIEGGSVRLQISEGRLAKISTEGNSVYSSEQLVSRLEGVSAGAVYRGTSLEHSLRTMNTLPGLQVRAVVRPGEEYGTSDLVLRATEKRLEGSLALDNYGRDNIGEIRYSLFAQINNPLRLADQLQLMALRSEEGLLTYGYAAYSVPVSRHGTQMSVSYGFADFEIKDSPVDGKNRTGRLSLEQSLIRDANQLLSASIGVLSIDANSDFGGVLLNDTLVTVLELGTHYSLVHPNTAITQVSANLATNFQRLTRDEITDAQLSGERLTGDQRLRLELDLQHLMPLAAGFQVLGRINGVYSPDPLVDTQQYSLGGPNSLRGFLPSEIRGDRGYFGSVTVRRPIAISSVRLTPRIFADSGTVFVVDAPVGVSEQESLTNVGVGLDLQYQRLNMKLDWSFPTDNHMASDGDNDHRLFGALSASF